MTIEYTITINITLSIPNYRSFCFFQYIVLVMYLDIRCVPRKVKTTYNLEQRHYVTTLKYFGLYSHFGL